ncbi:hypothetical protein [Streptomyces antibioticus]|uniref:hypothetical protein n=1 Tax=Streptomyces antibioticus TaxID=1890 RepID=UPI0033A30690
MSAVDWGDVPTWVAAVFAGLAARFAWQTIKSQRQQIGEQRAFIAEQSANLGLERAALRASAEDRKWSQARQVKVTCQKATSTFDGGVPGENDHWVVTVVNESDAALRGVEVRFGTAYLASGVWVLEPSLHNYGAVLGDRMVAPVDLLAARRGLRFESQQFASAPLHNNKPSVTFTDDNGVRWSLDYYGKLEEVPAEPSA